MTEVFEYQNQSPEGVLRNFAKFIVKHLCQESLATLLKKRLWHSCFPVNFVKFLRTSFLTEHLRWLLLEFGKNSDYNLRSDVHLENRNIRIVH